VPKWLRRYHARYGAGGVAALVAAHKQNPAPMLDHGRDRANRQPDLVLCRAGAALEAIPPPTE